jgi:ribosomal protein L30E
MSVIATLNIGANGATSLAGSSVGLSTAEDRKRFLALHRRAGAYVLGQKSAANELYTSSAAPVIILSRTLESRMKDGQEIINSSVGLEVVMRAIKTRFPAPIVVEAGPSLLLALVKKGCIEEIELSLSPIDGDGDFIDQSEITSHFTMLSDDTIKGTRLLHGRYNGDSAYS